ncbi:MAG: PD-(D/E)XK nuclease-like domain-containing protein [Allosphingosinicella sp.]
MNKRDLEDAMRDEVSEWPGVTIEFAPATGGGHPKAKLTFTPEGGEPLKLSRPYPSTPGTQQTLHKTLADIRRAMKQLGATRPKPEPSADEVEAKYRKPNDGAERRPDPVVGEPASKKPDMAEKLVAAGAATPEQAEIARASRGPDGPIRNDAGRPILIGEALDEDAERAVVRDLLPRLLACGLEIVLVGEISLAAVIAEAVDMIGDGIYFGLPDVIYHAVPRLSASGLQRLCVSPATFWKGSWLNPSRPGPDEDETKAQMLGKAYHIARLEPERFHGTYVRQIDPADFPAKGLLSSDAAVKAELKNRGLTQSIGTETPAERCERLLDDGYEGTLLPLEKAKWDATVAGRIPLRAKDFDQIVADMERIRHNDDIAELLTGGEAEVSIFWTDQHGLPMKARLDYLTPEWWDDFKTFDNSRGKELEQACADAVRYNRYHVQALVYRAAVEAVRLGAVQIKSEATDAQRALIAVIQIRPGELACWYIFQEKAGVPNLIAYDFPFYQVPLNTKLNHAGASAEAIARVEEAARIKSGLHIRALRDIDKAKRDFVLYSEVYEPGQEWQPIEARRRFNDSHFSRYWLEGEQA